MAAEDISPCESPVLCHLKALEGGSETNAKLFRRRTRSIWDPVHLKLTGNELHVKFIQSSSLVSRRIERKPSHKSETISLEECGLVQLRNKCMYLNLPNREKSSWWLFGMSPWTPDEKVIFKFSTHAEAAEWKERLYEATVHSARFRRQSS
jgi:hypothetical protein